MKVEWAGALGADTSALAGGRSTPGGGRRDHAGVAGVAGDRRKSFGKMTSPDKPCHRWFRP